MLIKDLGKIFDSLPNRSVGQEKSLEQIWYAIGIVRSQTSNFGLQDLSLARISKSVEKESLLL